MTSNSTAVPVIYAGDVGTVFRARILDQNNEAVNISTASLLEMRFRNPDGTVTAKTASLDGDGSDGYLRYVTVADDIPVGSEGAWRSQGHVQFPGGLNYSSSLYQFTVEPILDANWTP